MHHAPSSGRQAAASWVAGATAHPNIALVKYWGKRQQQLNLPAVGSLSITLDTLVSCCRIRPQGGSEDVIQLNAAPAAGNARRRIDILLQRMLGAVGCQGRPALSIQCDNNFPTGAGLASSASGFAALVLAVDQAAGLGLSAAQLGAWARRGSGSATRSLFGGFVLWPHGQRPDGEDSTAEPLFGRHHWPLEVVVAVVSYQHKQVGSGEGMERCRLTSPFYPTWCAGAEADLVAAQQAVAARDFPQLAAVSEHSCRKMLAVMHTARPTLNYWTPVSWAVVACIERLQAQQVAVFFTSDAGPQIKAVCAPGHGGRVAAALGAVPGVLDVLQLGLGEDAQRQAA